MTELEVWPLRRQAANISGNKKAAGHGRIIQIFNN